MLEWAWANAATLRDLAAVVAVVATFVGIVVTMWRTRVQRRVQREISAKQTWSRVLLLCFENPAFAEPPQGSVLHSHAEQGNRYIWFVSNVLNALDEILLASNDSNWLHTARQIIGYHKTWLSDPTFRRDEYLTYSTVLRGLIDEVTARNS